MTDNHVSMTGRVGTAPELVLAGGQPRTHFRLGCTRRYRDPGTGEWTDGRTTWVTVTCWRALARNVVRSVQVGDLVIVHGRLDFSEWESAEGRRSRLSLAADAVGFDLSTGIAEFHRVRWSATGPELPEPRDGAAPDEPQRVGAGAENDGAWAVGPTPGPADEPGPGADDPWLEEEPVEPVGV